MELIIKLNIADNVEISTLSGDNKAFLRYEFFHFQSGKQPVKILLCNIDSTFFCIHFRRPCEFSFGTLLVVKNESIRIPFQNFDGVFRAIRKNKETPGVEIFLKIVLDNPGKTGDVFAQIHQIPTEKHDVYFPL